MTRRSHGQDAGLRSTSNADITGKPSLFSGMGFKFWSLSSMAQSHVQGSYGEGSTLTKLHSRCVSVLCVSSKLPAMEAAAKSALAVHQTAG